MLKLGISDKVVTPWRRLVFFRGFFLKIIFLHGEILEFPLKEICLKIFFHVNCKAIMTHWKDGDQNFSIANLVSTKIFWSSWVGNQNPFSITNHDKGSWNVTKDFPMSILTNVTNAMDALRWMRCDAQRKMGTSHQFWQPWSKYHQIHIMDENVENTTMRTNYGSYRFLVILFRLCNTSSMFTTLGNLIFHEKLNEFVIIYIDDILVYSKITKKHVEHLEYVLSKLQ